MYGRDFITDLTPFFSNKATLCTSRYSDTLLGDTFWPVSKTTSSVFHLAVTIRTEVVTTKVRFRDPDFFQKIRENPQGVGLLFQFLIEASPNKSPTMVF